MQGNCVKQDIPQILDLHSMLVAVHTGRVLTQSYIWGPSIQQPGLPRMISQLVGLGWGGVWWGGVGWGGVGWGGVGWMGWGGAGWGGVWWGGVRWGGVGWGGHS
jgi:hypothetical protein